MSDITLQNNLLLFSTTHDAVADTDVRAYRASGAQSISALYDYAIEVECFTEGGIAPDIVKEMFRKPCWLGFGPEGTQRVYGIPREIEMIGMREDGRCTYGINLVPRLYRTTQVHRSRVFNEKSIPDIIREILTTDYVWQEDREFEIRLDGDYPQREFVAQYQETDFQFVSRWLEHYGISYYFEQTDDGEKVVFLDANANSLAVPGFDTMTYQHSEGITELPGVVTRLRRTNRSVPGRIHMRDYDWRGPNAVYGNADIDTQNGYGVQAFYGGHFSDETAGDQLATARAQEWGVHAERYNGLTSTSEMAPGFHFSLQGAPVGDLDIKYLVTAVSHEMEQDLSQGGGHVNTEFEAIAHETQYRPPRVTPWPRIDGVMHAHVDGAGSTAAPIDGDGRYRVQLPYDVNPGETGRATRWIRMAQSSAGNGYGIHFPLYPGTEVLLAHVGGDPDRPVIVGAVPNTANSTYIQQSRATRSAIRTISGVVIDIENDA